MAAYADYDYYTNTYGGTALPADDFNRLIPRASVLLDQMTRGRAEAHADEDPIKMAACAVAEGLAVSEQTGGAEIASESNDGVSVAYATRGTGVWNRLRALANVYLGGTGLLSRWC